MGLKPILRTPLPSVLWHCRLGHLTRKNRPRNDYSVFCGTLNLTQSINQVRLGLSVAPWFTVLLCAECVGVCVVERWCLLRAVSCPVTRWWRPLSTPWRQAAAAASRRPRRRPWRNWRRSRESSLRAWKPQPRRPLLTLHQRQKSLKV